MATTARIEWLVKQLASRADDDECWTDWPFAYFDGRPWVYYRPGPDAAGRSVPVARAVFHLTHGRFPYWACHRCPNHPLEEDRACWNPRHIYDGDPATNGQDQARNRAARERLGFQPAAQGPT